MFFACMESFSRARLSENEAATRREFFRAPSFVNLCIQTNLLAVTDNGDAVFIVTKAGKRPRAEATWNARH
jgi:hypothetical protein